MCANNTKLLCFYNKKFALGTNKLVGVINFDHNKNKTFSKQTNVLALY